MPYIYALLVTLAVTAWIGWQVALRLSVLRSGGRATGTVVGHKRVDGYEATIDHPVVTFTDPAGEVRRFRAEGPRSHGTRLGATVDVVYLRDNPSRAYVDSFLCMWWNVLLWAVMATVFWGVVLSLA